MIYFDNSATTFIKPDAVYTKVYDVMKKFAGNPGRSGHYLSMKANDIVYEARDTIAKYFNIDNVEQICFLPNATYALNFAIKGLVEKGDKVLVSGFEHNSVMRPLYNIGTKIEFIPWFNYNEYSNIEQMLDDVKIVIVNHMSNVNGNLADINTIGKIARKKNVIFMIDASQSAGHIDIDVKRDNIDILACAGHKGLMGPQGTGILYINNKLSLKTIIEGGTGSQSELLFQPDVLPDKFEAGTLNVPAIAGLCEGVKFLANFDSIYEYEKNLASYAIEGLNSIPNVTLYRNKNGERNTGVISFNLKSWDCVSLSNVLSENYGIMTRAGLHCSPLAHKTIGTLESGSARISLSCFNTKNEVDRFLEVIDKLSIV